MARSSHKTRRKRPVTEGVQWVRDPRSHPTSALYSARYINHTGGRLSKSWPLVMIYVPKYLFLESRSRLPASIRKQISSISR